MTSVQVFIVRDSYVVKRPPPEWGGYRGGDLRRGEWRLTLGERRCVWEQGEASGHLLLFTPPLWGRGAILRAGSISHSGEHFS